LVVKHKKIPKRFLENREKWETNRAKILEIISSDKFTYTEIISKSGLSDTAVLNHFKKMQEDKLIENKREGTRSYYVLTTKGNENLLDIIREQQETAGRLKDTGTTYFVNRSELGLTLTICSLPWGIDPHMTNNVKLEQLKLLKTQDVEEMEKLLFKKLSKNIRDIREHNVKFQNDALNLLETEKFVLSFNVNLPDLHKSIKQKSLETLENMSDEEVTARFEEELGYMENVGK